MKQFKIKVNGNEYMVEVEEMLTGQTAAPKAPAAPAVKTEPKETKIAPEPVKTEVKNEVAASSSEGEEVITAPMPGKILKINVSVGDTVQDGDTLLILEAMKMENEIVAGSSGKIKKISVSVNDMVETDEPLVIIG